MWPPAGLAPQCYVCARFRGVRRGVGFVCTAFPRIPHDILINRADHRKPYHGDHGQQFEPNEDLMPRLATDPPVSEKQRRAMFAAAAGHSNLGIPKKVGEEFVGKDMSPGDWRGLIRGLLKFFMEEKREEEHARDYNVVPRPSKTDTYGFLRGAQDYQGIPLRAAGVAFVTPDGKALFLKRSRTARDHAGEWAFPGGMLEQGETPEQAAIREAKEETGADAHEGAGGLMEAYRAVSDGIDFATYYQPVKDAFEPDLDGEHEGYLWAYPDHPPEPLHPGVKASLDASFEEIERAVRSEADDPDALAAWIKDRTDPGWRKRAGDAVQLHTREAPEMLDYIDKQSGDPPDTSMSRVVKREQPGYAHGGEGHPKAKIWNAKGAADALPLAFDKRVFDTEGRLHVDETNISKAVVNPYLGNEIPGYQALGLDPDKKYMLLRDPDELGKPETVASFNGLPVLSQHIPIDAYDHADKSEYVIGATGTNAKFTDPYLTNDLVFWPKAAIDRIEDGSKRELSAAYQYKPVMEPGTYKGQRYDGRMTNIRGNHIAAVVEGRAGSDVAVDSVIIDWKFVEKAILSL